MTEIYQPPHRYWVHYVYKLSTGQIGYGSAAIYREEPLKDVYEVIKMQEFIRTELVPENGIPVPDTLIVQSWQHFEVNGGF